MSRVDPLPPSPASCPPAGPECARDYHQHRAVLAFLAVPARPGQDLQTPARLMGPRWPPPPRGRSSRTVGPMKDPPTLASLLQCGLAPATKPQVPRAARSWQDRGPRRAPPASVVHSHWHPSRPWSFGNGWIGLSDAFGVPGAPHPSSWAPRLSLGTPGQSSMPTALPQLPGWGCREALCLFCMNLSAF